MNILRLKEFREQADLSQRDIAVMFDLTQQAYSKWENGKSSPNAVQILQLCKIFNCKPNDLFILD